jgi:hypothetical protein
LFNCSQECTYIKIFLKLYGLFISILILAIIVWGCALADRRNAGKVIAEEEAPKWEPGKGDAYLFDVKIYREGKKNSVRLDVYRTGDTISIFARGYLGKGVLKGLIRPDSILIYFPTEKEYFSGKLADLVDNGCADSLPLEFTIIQLFQKTPAEIDFDLGNFYIVIENENSSFRQYRMESHTCPQGIDISYTPKDDRFIPDEIIYTSADELFRFKAKRRRAKLNIDIPGKKFQINIPAGTVRISP